MRPLLLACTCAILQAAYPPQDPASSLDALLHDIWTYGANHAYGPAGRITRLTGS